MAETRTTIDSLIELLRTKGKMELGAISVAIGVDPKIVEGWANVLEKGNLVKITYEVGKMYISPSILTPEQETKVKSTLDAKSVTLESDISTQLISIEKLTEAIEKIKTTTATSEKIYAEQMPEIHKTVSEINKIYDYVQERGNSIAAISKRASETYDNINKRITELDARIEHTNVGVEGKGVEEIRGMINQLVKEAEAADSEISSASKTTTDYMEQLSKNVEVQTKNLHSKIEKDRREMETRLRNYSKQIETLESQLKEREKHVKGSFEEVNTFIKEKERLKKQLSDAKVEFNNMYSKTNEEMQKSVSRVDDLSKVLLNKIDTFKKGFGESVAIYDSIDKAKKEVSDIETESNQIRQELQRMGEQLRALKALSSISIEQKMAAMSELEVKEKEKVARLEKVKKRAQEAGENTKKLIPEDDNAKAS